MSKAFRRKCREVHIFFCLLYRSSKMWVDSYCFALSSACFLHHIASKKNSPGICTSHHCAHCCLQCHQTQTWHPPQQQQHGRVCLKEPGSLELAGLLTRSDCPGRSCSRKIMKMNECQWVLGHAHNLVCLITLSVFMQKSLHGYIHRPLLFNSTEPWMRCSPVKVIWKGGISCSPKHIKVPVKGDHCVSVASGGGRRGTPQDVFRGDACPAVRWGRRCIYCSSRLMKNN